jgi:hypothetical protein
MWLRIPTTVRFVIVCCIALAFAWSQRWAGWSLVPAGILGTIGLLRVFGAVAMTHMTHKLKGMTPDQREKFLSGMTPEKRHAILAEYGIHDETVKPTPGCVVFQEAGISIETEESWQRIELSPGLPVCPPTLIGPSGMVRGMLFRPEFTEPAGAAEQLRNAHAANSPQLAVTFRQEEFSTEAGLKGIHTSHSQPSESEASPGEVRSHNYIVKNHAGRCAAINYITTSQRDIDSVHQMVRRSLRLV